MTTLFSAGTQLANTARDNLLSSRFVFGWKLIEESVLTGSVASIAFSSIPGIYRMLVMTLQVRTDRASSVDHARWRANADAGANYDVIFSAGIANNTRSSGGAVAATSAYAGRSEGATSRASNFAISQTYWPGYALTDREKMSYTFGTNFANTVLAGMTVIHFSSRWRNTAAITSLTLIPETGPNFISGCRFALYGVL
jgi:hypothetical protein